MQHRKKLRRSITLPTRQHRSYGIEPLERRQLMANILAFTAAPATANAGSIINSPAGVQVTVETSAGVPITTNTDSITVSIGTNPGAAMLSGTVTVSAVKGVATFGNLSVNTAMNGYTLVAKDNTSSTTANSTSSPFNVDAIPSFSDLHSVVGGAIGYSPESALVRDSAGNLYGTTLSGGAYGFGTVFELSGTGYNTITGLVSFTGTGGVSPGASPDASLAFDSSGNLYGTTSAGGTSNDGTVFELSGANHTTFTSLASFTGAAGTEPGQTPTAGLSLDSSGNIYGTTSGGGALGDGTVFSLTGSGHTTFKSLISFTGSSGSYPGESPDSVLALDSSGDLFGVTQFDGSGGYGTVFEISAPTYSTFTTLVSFTGSNGIAPGGDPRGDLAFDSSGNLIGTCSFGGSTEAGTIFELSGASHTSFAILITFTGTSGTKLGSYPQGGFVADSAGNLYGTTYDGGTIGFGGGGTAYELSGTNHTTFTSLVSFNSSSTNALYGPYAGMVIDGSGNLFGTTAGGPGTAGTVFEIPLASRSTSTILYSFSVENSIPQTKLLIDNSGNIFGCNGTGGPNDDGTIFELSGPNHTTYTTLISFSGTSGAYLGDGPSALVFDSSGNIYGVTNTGGSSGFGTVFELSGTNYGTFTSLISFTGTTGAYPGANVFGGLTYDSTTGNFFGTTLSGGTSNLGTVFQLSGSGHTIFTSLVSFTGPTGSTPGAFPRTSPALDSSDNLYGTTTGGSGDGVGTIYELSGTNHTVFTNLIVFTGSTGAQPGTYPDGNLLIDANSNIYGTTVGGGANSDGMVFELAAPAHTTLTTVISFTGASGTDPGIQPTAGLMFGADGNLYGSTTVGGTGSNGIIFELSGAGYSTYTPLVLLTGTSGNFLGRDPYAALAVDSNGNLYGTGDFGGLYGYGAVFELARNIPIGLTSTSGVVTIAPPFGVDGITNEYISSVSVGAGSTIAMTPSASTATVLLSNALNIAGATGSWTGTFDLTNDAIDIPGASLTTVFNQVAQGFNGGTWTGMGITSSAAAANSTHLTAIGVIQNNQSGTAIYTATNLFDGTAPAASDILMKYTYYGDANLDGKVDGSDYTKIDAGFGSKGNLTGWLNGDFNYDGKIDGSDYTLIDNAFNKQGVSLAAIIATPSAKLVAPMTFSDVLSPSRKSQVSISVKPIIPTGYFVTSAGSTAQKSEPEILTEYPIFQTRKLTAAKPIGDSRPIGLDAVDAISPALTPA